ncbi:Cyclin-dependent kinase B1-1 [Lobulomyces angularis]|nr:Cyclin-dependent kinase B1-1 [Lobulomyces angularis]
MVSKWKYDPNQSKSKKVEKFIDIFDHLGDIYRTHHRLGKGSYAEVFKVSLVNSSGNEHYALKKTHEDADAIRPGICQSTLREINIMQELDNINIMSLNKIYRFHSSQNIFMEMDIASYDLQTLIGNESKHFPIPHADVKFYTFQILQGLDYCYRMQLIHRDLKPANVLVFEKSGIKILKIADWGLSRQICQPSKGSYTPETQTLLYRSPEVVLMREKSDGMANYFCEIDMWSCGLIVAELLKGRTLLNPDLCKNEVGLINEFKRIIGFPARNSEIFPDHLYSMDNGYESVNFELTIFENRADDDTRLKKEALSFMRRMIQFDPVKRVKTFEAILDKYLEDQFDAPALKQIYRDNLQALDRKFYMKRNLMIEDLTVTSKELKETKLEGRDSCYGSEVNNVNMEIENTDPSKTNFSPCSSPKYHKSNNSISNVKPSRHSTIPTPPNELAESGVKGIINRFSNI